VPNIRGVAQVRPRASLGVSQSFYSGRPSCGFPCHYITVCLLATSPLGSSSVLNECTHVGEASEVRCMPSGHAAEHEVEARTGPAQVPVNDMRRSKFWCPEASGTPKNVGRVRLLPHSPRSLLLFLSSRPLQRRQLEGGGGGGLGVGGGGEVKEARVLWPHRGVRWGQSLLG